MISIKRGPSSEEVVWTSAEILHVEYRFVFTFFLHVSNWNRHPVQEDTLELESLKNSTHFSSSNILDGRFKVGLKTFLLVVFAHLRPAGFWQGSALYDAQRASTQIMSPLDLLAAALLF